LVFHHSSVQYGRGETPIPTALSCESEDQKKD
jgi:hypothetical protein